MLRLLVCFSVLSFLLSGCIDVGDDGDAPVQRPMGYFRIDMPEKNYHVYDSTCPFRAEIPGYSFIRKSPDPNAGDCWLNWYFPRYKATVHLTYNDVNNNFDALLAQSWSLISSHNIKAGGQGPSPVNRTDEKVYGNVVFIGGTAASPIQFYLTDSTKHFLHGSLYFFARPNADSIAPVLNFVKADVEHFTKTLKWK